MSRLIAVSKLLYYPTPLRIMSGIARLIELKHQETETELETNPAPAQATALRVLDPCAGRGTAAYFLAQYLAMRTNHKSQKPVWMINNKLIASQKQEGEGEGKTTTPTPKGWLDLYGIELEQYRAEAAAQVMTHTLNTNTLTARISPKAFDLIFHNPPYDTSGDSNKRLEHVFLKRITTLLCPDGLLVHVVPQKSIELSAEWLAAYFTDISLYRFPEPEYSNFNQVVLFGLRRNSVLFGEERKMLIEWLKEMANRDKLDLPVLSCPSVEKLVEQIAATGAEGPEVTEELNQLQLHNNQNPLDIEISSANSSSISAQAPVLEQIKTAEVLLELEDSTNKNSKVKAKTNHPNTQKAKAKIYQVQPLAQSLFKEGIFTFDLGEYNSALAREEADRAGIWASRSNREMIFGSASNANSSNNNKAKCIMRPLMPLREGQGALLVTVGLLNNLVLEDASTSKQVLVKGHTYKEFKVIGSKTNEDGETVSTTEKEIIKTELKALDLATGKLETIKPENLTEFVRQYKTSIQGQMLANYPPLYVPRKVQTDPAVQLIEEGMRKRIPANRKPLGGQQIAIAATALALTKQKGTIISAEQGSGKTLMASVAAYMAGMRRIVVVCPTHLAKKWAREITITIPGARAVIVTSVSDLEKAKRDILTHERNQKAMLQSEGVVSQQRRIGINADPPFFVIMTTTKMKLNSYWRSSVVIKIPNARFGNRPKDEYGNYLKYPHCPKCEEILVDEETGLLPMDLELLSTKKHRCPNCSEPLWQPIAKLKEFPSKDYLPQNKASVPAFIQDKLSSDKPKIQAEGQRELDALKAKTTEERDALRSIGLNIRQLKLQGKSEKERKKEQGPRRIPLAKYIKIKMHNFFDLVIFDECHELKGRDSAQGVSGGSLTDVCKHSLCLTGTLAGGYSTNLFYLLWRFTDKLRNEFNLNDAMKWAWLYGIIEKTTFSKNDNDDDDDDIIEDGTMSDRRTRGKSLIQERPGINPAILLKMIENTVFLKITDVSKDLPPYQEHVMLLPMSKELQKNYDNLANALNQAVRQALVKGSSRLLGALVTSLLAWPDKPVVAEVVIDPKDGSCIASAPAMPADQLYPKEERLLELYRNEKAAGRKILIFITNTNERDIAPRLKWVLEKEKARVAILRSNKVDPADREEWIQKQLKKGLDALICHPQLVQTGLDLLDFPTILFYQINYSTYVARQASRRSWRIGQKLPVHVYHFAYEGSAQKRALLHNAKKIQAAQMLEGDLSSDGLVELAEEENSDNLFLELARSLVNKSEPVTQTSNNNIIEGEVVSSSTVTTANAEEDTDGMSLEALMNSLHQQELAATAFILEQEDATEEELEAAIAQVYEGMVPSSTTITTTQQTNIKTETIATSNDGGSGSKETSAPSSSKPTFEQLRAMMLNARSSRRKGKSEEEGSKQLALF